MSTTSGTPLVPGERLRKQRTFSHRRKGHINETFRPPQPVTRRPARRRPLGWPTPSLASLRLMMIKVSVPRATQTRKTALGPTIRRDSEPGLGTETAAHWQGRRRGDTPGPTRPGPVTRWWDTVTALAATLQLGTARQHARRRRARQPAWPGPGAANPIPKLIQNVNLSEK